MIRFLLKIAALLIAGILIYNYFFGTNEEKEQSRKVFGQMKDVVVSVSELVKSEKEKFDAGKYDAALSKLGQAYQVVRKQAQYLDASMTKRLDELEQRQATLKKELNSIEQEDQKAAAQNKGAKSDPKAEKAKAAEQQRRKEELQQELEQLLKDSENLFQQAHEQK